MTLIFIIILSTNLISYILGLNTTFSQEILNNNITLVAKEKNLKEEIEQRKESENKLRTLFSELQLAYERVNQFSHMVSHNMRSPIANIKGLMNIINTHKISETEKKEYLHIILNCVDKLDKVIIDMNEILHIQHNINESKSIVDFQEELNSVLVIENQSLNDAGAKIISDFEKIPNIYTVKSFIHSILLNLVVNALKYKKPDKKPLIKITSYIHLDHIFLEVSDNGLGIDLVTHKDSIFLPYKQFHSHAYGKGLGLYLVNTQAQLLGGNVSVKSEIGKGTTFVVDLGKMD